MTLEERVALLELFDATTERRLERLEQRADEPPPPRPLPVRSWLEITVQLLNAAGWFVATVYIWRHR